MSLYIDLTEFLSNPVKTGIQRIEGEICKHLAEDTAIPIRFHNSRYFSLSSSLIGHIGRYFSGDTEQEVDQIQLLGAAGAGTAIQLRESDRVLVPELFYDPCRVAFFRAMKDSELQRFRFIVCDLLPVTHPEHFAADMPLDIIYGYFQLIRRASHCGFISERTRDAYYGRLRRTTERSGVVLPLGSDGLGPRAEKVVRNRPLKFSVIGTIEPRKNHAMILEAFKPLLRQIKGLSLCFVGRMGWVEADFAEKIERMAADTSSGFKFYMAPNDLEIKNHVLESRATIYASSVEGYGLPPMESLWLGTPVIASTAIPSLDGIGNSGIHYVEPLTSLNLRKAVTAFINTDYADQKSQEAISLKLPTWQLLTDEVVRWCRSE